jgi:hypothetical protein
MLHLLGLPGLRPGELIEDGRFRHRGIDDSPAGGESPVNFREMQ